MSRSSASIKTNLVKSRIKGKKLRGSVSSYACSACGILCCMKIILEWTFQSYIYPFNADPPSPQYVRCSPTRPTRHHPTYSESRRFPSQ